jgi:DNA transformation protein and related proteins
MPNTSSFVEHVADLLSLLGRVEVRRMFGGHGAYLRGVMFALIDDDEVFLKTDEESRPRFLARGCAMWVYPGSSETSYYRPPDEAHEDAEAMLPWARLGLEAALRLKAAKEARAKAVAERKAARGSAPKAKSKTRSKARSKAKKKVTHARRRHSGRRAGMPRAGQSTAGD